MTTDAIAVASTSMPIGTLEDRAMSTGGKQVDALTWIVAA